MENDFSLVGLDIDTASVDIGVAMEGSENFVLHVLGQRSRFDGDTACQGDNADEVPYGVEGSIPLVLPIDLTFKGNGTLGDDDFDFFEGDQGVVFQGV
jgi:hypothetical protein